MASHDRAFLDAVVTRIWELRDRRLVPFRGAYSAYLVQREQADARQRKDAETQSEQIAREQELIQKYRSQRKHTKMHEHERRLEALRQERVEAPRSRPGWPCRPLRCWVPGRSGRVRSRSASRGSWSASRGPPSSRPASPSWRSPGWRPPRGDRIGVVGPNGAGKTTLLRTIAGELPRWRGSSGVGHNTTPGYLAQLRRAGVPGATVLDAILAAGARRDRAGALLPRPVPVPR